MDSRGFWQPPQPPGLRRADHTAIVGCDLFADGLAVESPGAAADLERLHRKARERDGSFVWLDLHEPSEAALARAAAAFGLDPLAVEDTLHREQRVKIERYAEMVFLVLRTAHYASEGVTTGFVRLFVGPHFVIAVRQGSVLELTSLRAELGAELAGGPWAVAHAVLERLVDVYVDIAGELQTDVDLAETGVFTPGSQVPIEQLYQLKRQLMRFKAAVLPLHRPLAALTGRQFAGPPKEIRRRLRAVTDHHSAAVDEVHALDEVINALLQARLTQLTVDQNNDMRRIASWAAIAALITTIAGVYGMNFTHMPELGWRYGYPSVALFMVVSSAVLYRLLRRSRWL